MLDKWPEKWRSLFSTGVYLSLKVNMENKVFIHYFLYKWIMKIYISILQSKNQVFLFSYYFFHR